MPPHNLNDGRPVIAPNQTFTLDHKTHGVIGTVKASDPDLGDRLTDWQIKGGNGAYKFTINKATGDIRVADEDDIDLLLGATYTLIVMIGDGKLPSHDQVVMIVVSRSTTTALEGQPEAVVSGLRFAVRVFFENFPTHHS